MCFVVTVHADSDNIDSPTFERRDALRFRLEFLLACRVPEGRPIEDWGWAGDARMLEAMRYLEGVGLVEYRQGRVYLTPLGETVLQRLESLLAESATGGNEIVE